MFSDQPRPDEAAIRRALAECMTAGDIDDAMGWPPGTARRRRWRAPDRGGLPNADAELGGIAIWFRSTFDAWRSAPPVRPRLPRRDQAPAEPAAAPPAAAADEAPEVPETPEFAPAAEDATAAAGSDEADEVRQPHDASAEVPTTEPGVDLVERAEEPTDAGPPGAPPPAAPASISSGFDVAVGQHVLADVHGGWHDAVVAHRDRTTVVVEYQINETPLGTRRQRIGTDRIRVPTK